MYNYTLNIVIFLTDFGGIVAKCTKIFLKFVQILSTKLLTLS